MQVPAQGKHFFREEKEAQRVQSKNSLYLFMGWALDRKEGESFFFLLLCYPPRSWEHPILVSQVCLRFLFIVAQLVKNPPAIQETWVWSLSWDNPLEEGMTTTPVFWPGEFHGLYSPGQNTGVGSLSLLHGIFPTQGSNPCLLYCRWILYQLSHKVSEKEVCNYFKWKGKI